MTLTVGLGLIHQARMAAAVTAHRQRFNRFLCAEERAHGLPDAALFAAKVAVVKAVGELSIFDATTFVITPVRSGYAAIPRHQKFEQRLVQAGLSWVAVTCGEANETCWSVATAMSTAVPDFDAVLVVRNVADLMAAPDRLDAESRTEIARQPNPELARAARHAAVEAAELLSEYSCDIVGLRARTGGRLAFSAPAPLRALSVAVALAGRYVAACVARQAAVRRLRVQICDPVANTEIS